MDAVRLIGVGRRALADSHEAPDVMVEAWQAQSLAQAIGSRLAVAGPPELRGEALGLSEIGGRGCGALTSPLFGVDRIRAAQLSEIPDARETLTGLGALLGEVGIALVGIASTAAEDRIYWQCMEAIDAADECQDRILEMLRRLTDREHALTESAGDPDPAEEEAGSGGGGAGGLGGSHGPALRARPGVTRRAVVEMGAVMEIQTDPEWVG